MFTGLLVFCLRLCVRVCVCVLFRKSNKGAPCTTLSPTPLRKHIASQPKWQLLENQWLFTEESTPRGRHGDVYKTRDSRIFSLPCSPLQHPDMLLITSSPLRPSAESDCVTLQTIQTALCCQTKNYFLMFPSRIGN